MEEIEVGLLVHLEDPDRRGEPVLHPVDPHCCELVILERGDKGGIRRKGLPPGVGERMTVPVEGVCFQNLAANFRVPAEGKARRLAERLEERARHRV